MSSGQSSLQNKCESGVGFQQLASTEGEDGLELMLAGLFSVGQVGGGG